MMKPAVFRVLKIVILALIFGLGYFAASFQESIELSQCKAENEELRRDLETCAEHGLTLAEHLINCLEKQKK